MKKLLDQIFFAGIDGQTSPEQTDEIKSINFIGFSLTLLVWLIGSIAYIFIDQLLDFIILLTAVQTLFLIVVIALNTIQKYFEAKLFFSLNVTALCLLLIGYFGLSSNFHFVVPIGYLSLVFLYRNGTRRDYLAVLIGTVLTLSLTSVFYLTDIKSVLTLDQEDTEKIRFLSFISICAIAVIIGTHLFFIFIRSHRRTQQSLEVLSKDALILATISDNVIEGLFKSDGSFNLQFINTSFPKVFGFESKTALYEVEPESLFADKASLHQLIEKIRRGKFISNELIQLKRKDGSLFFGRISARLIIEEQDETIVGVITDVTQQQEQEESIKQSELRLREAQQMAKIGDWTLVDGDDSMRWSEETYRVFGFENEKQFTPNLAHLIKHFDHLDSEAVNFQLEGAKKYGDERKLGGWYTAPNGDHKYLQITSKYQLDQATEGKWLGTVQDITGIKKMEEQVEGNTRFFETILDHAPLEIAILDDELKYVFISAQAIKNPDIRKWIIGKDDFQYCQYRNHPVAIAKDRRKHLEQALESGEVVRWEEEMKDEFGFSNFMFRNICKVVDPIDNKAYLVGFSFNFSRLKETQISLEIKNEELDKLNKELDSFVYSISHDLRSPISTVIGLISLAQESQSLVEIKQILGMQKEALDRLDIYMRDVIDYSRNRRLEPKAEHLDLEQLVNQCIENQQYLPDYERISFFCEFDEGKHVWSDNMRVQIIINNLISNAVKYADSKKQHNYIGVTTKSNTQGIEITIADNGIGIDESYLDKIWDMFYRATSANNGSGLGLYILKEALDNLNGQISVETELGKGTTFRVHIPDMMAN